MRDAGRSWRRVWVELTAAIVACGLLVPLAPPSVAGTGARAGLSFPGRSPRRTCRDGGRGSAAVPGARRATLPSDDWTYRPTVIVRRGTSQGSGTIIASIDGLTLVLTAAHVVKDEGPIRVELHRYNLGMERKQATKGGWPRTVAASLAATVTSADLAVVRIDNMTALPYVARVAHNKQNPAPDSILTSIGIDLGKKLTSWNTRLVEIVSFELNDSRELRPFLITEKIPSTAGPAAVCSRATASWSESASDTPSW